MLDTDPLDAEGGSDRGKIDCGVSHVHGDELAPGRSLAEVLEHVELENPVGRIVGDDPGNRNLVVGGRPERLNGIKSGAIADDRENRPVRAGQLDAYGVRHAGAKPTAGRAVVRAGLGEAEVSP